MMRYLAGRVLHGMALLVLISIFCFVLFQLAPGNYIDAVRLDPSVSAETAAMLRARYDLDRPLPSRYLAWLSSALRGEFGFSFAYGMPVGQLLWPRITNTVVLTGSAALLTWLAALLIGGAAAVTRSRVMRRLVTTSMSVLIAVPELLVALALLMLALRMGLFQAAGGMDSASNGWMFAPLSRLFLPVAALLLVSLPVLVRHVDAALREALQSPFIEAARAHGIPRRRILLAYALPAAANPLISLFGLSIGGLLSASLVVEALMGWPGLGPLVLEAVLSRDTPVVIAATLISGALFVLGNLIADVLIFATDPRIRPTS